MTMVKRYNFLLSLLFLGLFTTIWAQSPPNLTSNIYWTDTGGTYNISGGLFNATFNGVTDIAAAFNNARRGEETQKGLTSGVLGTLTMPSQAAWDAMGENDKALYLINAERTARAGVNYSGTVVKGLPLAGISQQMDDLALAYANRNIALNGFSHYYYLSGYTPGAEPSPANTTNSTDYSPFVRINNTPIVKDCKEFLNRAENIAGFWTSSSDPNTIKLPLERAIYTWLYEDGSSWGHRQALLLQDVDLGNNAGYGFDDNTGSMGTEGLMGIAAVGATGYTRGLGGMNSGYVVVFEVFDPAPNSAACTDSALPISLISFMASTEHQTAVLHWETPVAANDAFVVEMATRRVINQVPQPLEFSEAGTVALGETSGSGVVYSFRTAHLAAGSYAFRLKKQTADGPVAYSAVQEVVITEQPEQFAIFSAYPNPFSQTIRVDLVTQTDQQVKLRVIDVLGRTVENLSDAEVTAQVRHTVQVSLGDLPSGLYFIVAESSLGRKTTPIVKQ